MKSSNCCLSLLFAVLVFASIGIKAQDKQKTATRQISVSLADELKNLYDVSQLPVYRENTTPEQVSSYDTTGGNDDGFSGKFSFIRRNPDSSLVLLDVQGSGVINRIWTPTPTEDTLDFYIDDSSKPRLTIKFSDLFSGKVFPFVGPLCGNQLGGYFCYFPILFQKSCRLVTRGKKMQFQQVGYRLFPAGTNVQSFHADLTKEERQLLANISSFWNKQSKAVADYIPGNSQDYLTKTATFTLKPGETKNLFNLAEGGRIIGFEFYHAGNPASLNKNIDLKINWDNELNPAVYCPVADLFGYAFGSHSMQSLLSGSRNDTDYCFFPMPFDKSASMELIYRNSSETKSPVQVNARIYYSKKQRNAAREGKFYTSWRSNLLKEGTGPHVFLDTKGKGHYVGTILQADGTRPGMTFFFEGDDSTAIDGMFRMHGTGSEDYFNGGWYALADRWDTRMSLPLHGALDYSLPFSRTGAYRLYLSDKMSFQTSLYHSMEHGPVGNNMPVFYTSLALYYSNAPVTTLIKPTNELSKVLIPDTMILYPQLMDFNVSGNIDFRRLGAYNTGGESFVFTSNGQSQFRIPLDMIPVGRYKLLLDFTSTPEGCDFSLWQRQSQLTDWISSSKPTQERTDQLQLCELNITDLVHTVTFRLRPTGDKKSLFISRLILVKV